MLSADLLLMTANSSKACLATLASWMPSSVLDHAIGSTVL